MWVFPLAAAIVALAFAASLARRFARSRRLHLAMWSAALVMYAIASLAVAIGALAGWSRSLFEIYWILGAVLNVPLLAAGIVLAAAPIVIVYLVFQRRIVNGIAVGAVKG